MERTYGCDQVTLLANSLSSLIAVRAASQDRRVIHLVCVVGVVNLTYTLVKVYQEDLVGGLSMGGVMGSWISWGTKCIWIVFSRRPFADNFTAWRTWPGTSRNRRTHFLVSRFE